MSTLAKRWSIKPPAAPEVLAAYAGMNPILARVLFARGCETLAGAERFLRADTGAVDPFRMEGMWWAVKRIGAAIERQEPIVVYGDFDADGVTSTVLLVQALRTLGAHVAHYIPDRVDEGYGLNTGALDRLKSQGASLVITVDCGIRSLAEVQHGQALGLCMIVTDHHSVGAELPNAYAVINPKQPTCAYDEKMLAGVGIAYRLAEALYVDRMPGAGLGELGERLRALVDLVAIGTVADMAPLDRLENRALVREGLAVLNEAQRPGIRALLEKARIKPGMVTASSIGFALGPRINAAGRLANARLAYDLLAATDNAAAVALAEELDSLNRDRQKLTQDALALIRDEVERDAGERPLIWAQNREFRSGIVGLVAGRLSEEYYRPAVVMEEGDEESRASCRSIPGFDITAALDECADLLVRHGGHAQAAGFTVRNENLETLKRQLFEIAERQMRDLDLAPVLEIDAEVGPRELTLALVDDLARLEPTGQLNAAPLLVTRGLRVEDKRAVGKEGEHLKLRLQRDGLRFDAIRFRNGGRLADVPDCVDAAYTIEKNEYNGTTRLQMRVVDLRPAEPH